MRWSSGSCVVPVAHDFERRYADRVAGRYTWCSGLSGSLLMSESVGRRRGVRVVACTILECSVRWRGTWNGKGADGGRGRGAGGTGERWACVHRDDNGEPSELLSTPSRSVWPEGFACRVALAVLRAARCESGGGRWGDIVHGKGEFGMGRLSLRRVVGMRRTRKSSFYLRRGGLREDPRSPAFVG